MNQTMSRIDYLNKQNLKAQKPQIPCQMTQNLDRPSLAVRVGLHLTLEYFGIQSSS